MASVPSSARTEKTHERILLAAAEIFTHSGYSATTTRGIAAAAGVSELTLFRHFGSKQNLFSAVITRFSPLPGLVDLFESRLTWDFCADLTLIGQTFLEALLLRKEAIVMALFEAQRQEDVRRANLAVPAQIRGLMADYLREQIRRGVVRPVDAEAAAQAFLGMFLAYALSGQAGEQPQSENALSLFVEIFNRGVICEKSPQI